MGPVVMHFGFVMRLGKITLHLIKRDVDACAAYRQGEENYVP